MKNTRLSQLPTDLPTLFSIPSLTCAARINHNGIHVVPGGRLVVALDRSVAARLRGRERCRRARGRRFGRHEIAAVQLDGGGGGGRARQQGDGEQGDEGELWKEGRVRESAGVFV